MKMELLDDLLVDTYSGDYTAIVKVIGGYLRDNTGAKVELQRLGKGRANVIAAFGEPDRVINCHMDTVPPSANWTYEPLAATKKGGKVYGLGTADTKGNIYCALKAAASSKPKDVMLLFTVDEELGQFDSGVRLFLGSGKHEGVKSAVVCEPTGVTRIGCHKGYYSYKFAINGEAGHSSLGSKGNPIVKAAKLMVELDKLGFNVGTVSGGVRGNVVPESCEFKVSLRTYETPEAINKKVWEMVASDPSIEVAQSFNGAPLSHPSKLGKGLAEAPFWTEASLFAERGIDAIVYGAGNIQQAHSSDEFVSVEQLETAQKYLAKVMEGKA